MSPETTAGAHAPDIVLVRPRARWHRWAAVIGLGLAMAQLLWPVAAEHAYWHEDRGSFLLIGWVVLLESNWWVVPLLAFLVPWMVFDLVNNPTRQTALDAFSLSVSRLFIEVLLMIALVEAGFRISALAPTWLLAWLALLAVAALEVARLISIGGPVSVIRQLIQRPPWRRRSKLLVAPAVLGLLAGAVYLVFSAISAFFGLSLLPLLATAIVLFFCGVLSICGAFGLWERRGWAPWLHLMLHGPPTLGFSLAAFAALFLHPVYALAIGLVPLGLGFLTFYGLCVGVNQTPQKSQVAMCHGCGTRRWLTSARCEVCGEWLWIDRRVIKAPTCVGCGHEQPEHVPHCDLCCNRLQAKEVLRNQQQAAEPEATET
jgi:hypothetical protein